MKITGHILFYYDIRSKFFQVVLWFSIFISHGTQKLLFWIIWMHSCMRCANSCNSARMYENYQAFLQTDYQFTTNTYAKYMRGKKKANEMYSHLSRDRTHSWGPVCSSVNTPVYAHVLPCVKSPCSEEWRSIVERTRKVMMDNLEKWKCFCVITWQPYIARTIPVTHQDSSKYFLLAHPPILFLRKSSKHHLLSHTEISEKTVPMQFSQNETKMVKFSLGGDPL